jgi:hypothetical protein
MFHVEAGVASTNSPIESYNNSFKDNFTKRVRFNMLPILEILVSALAFESTVKPYTRRKVDPITNRYARDILKSKQFKRIDKSDDSVTYEYKNKHETIFVMEIASNQCECSACNE